MKKQIIVILAALLMVAACSEEKKDKLTVWKQTLAAQKDSLSQLKASIRALSDSIAAYDPVFAAKRENAVLVTLEQLEPVSFRHYFSVTGNLESDQNINISAQMPGKILSIKVEPGEMVKKNQVLAIIDEAGLRETLAELNTRLELATTMFEKQEKLWKQDVGTEVQYLQAKNNKEALEKSIAQVQSQLAQVYVKAPFEGVVHEVYAHQGEYASPGMPLVTMVSNQKPYIKAEISERYLGKVKPGDEVIVEYPAIGKTDTSVIRSVGQLLNPANRTFKIEVKVNHYKNLLKPMMLAVVKITDQVANNAVVISNNLIQTDEVGEFVFAAVKKDGRFRAKKVRIKRGGTFDNQTQILSGLSTTDHIVREGFRDVTDGALLQVAKNFNAYNQ